MEGKRIIALEKRVLELETKASKTARKTLTTRSQQILILKYLGFFSAKVDLNISNKKKSKLLSVLLNASSDNIEGDLSDLNKKISSLKSSTNYDVLIQTFTEAGLKDIVREIEKDKESFLKAQENSTKS